MSEEEREKLYYITALIRSSNETFDIILGPEECSLLIKYIDSLKLCNSDYYNQINNLSSKIFRIKERLDYIETNTETLSNDILDIINDKEISLKHIENHTKEDNK